MDLLIALIVVFLSYYFFHTLIAVLIVLAICVLALYFVRGLRSGRF